MALRFARRKNSSRSGGVEPPDPHGPPPWLFQGMGCLLARPLALRGQCPAVIDEAPPSHNASWRRAAEQRIKSSAFSMGALSFLRPPDTFVDNGGEAGLVFRPVLMLLPSGLVPDGRIDGRELCISFRP